MLCPWADCDSPCWQSETLSKKQEIDATNLQLYNLNYEKNHFSKQIRACRDFKGSYSNIDLVPVEQFRRDAPTELSAVDQSDGLWMISPVLIRSVQTTSTS